MLLHLFCHVLGICLLIFIPVWCFWISTLWHEHATRLMWQAIGEISYQLTTLFSILMNSRHTCQFRTFTSSRMSCFLKCFLNCFFVWKKYYFNIIGKHFLNKLFAQHYFNRFRFRNKLTKMFFSWEWNLTEFEVGLFLEFGGGAHFVFFLLLTAPLLEGKDGAKNIFYDTLHCSFRIVFCSILCREREREKERELRLYTHKQSIHLHKLKYKWKKKS